MTETAPTTPGLRLRTRQLLTETLAATALELFDTAGYEEVTVAEIAKAAGISQRSFFRYFPNKEDVVFSDHLPTAEEVRDELRLHLAEHPAWPALAATFQAAARQIDADPGHWKLAVKVICSTPALRARYLEKNMGVADALAAEITPRIDPGSPDAEVKAQTMVATAFSCFDVAITRWALDRLDAPLETIVAQVFGFVQIPHA